MYICLTSWAITIHDAFICSVHFVYELCVLSVLLFFLFICFLLYQIWYTHISNKLCHFLRLFGSIRCWHIYSMLPLDIHAHGERAHTENPAKNSSLLVVISYNAGNSNFGVAVTNSKYWQWHHSVTRKLILMHHINRCTSEIGIALQIPPNKV